MGAALVYQREEIEILFAHSRFENDINHFILIPTRADENVAKRVANKAASIEFYPFLPYPICCRHKETICHRMTTHDGLPGILAIEFGGSWFATNRCRI